MQADEFEFQIQRMAKFFGKKLSDDQIDIWFEKCGALDAFDFRSAVNEAISEERAFPTPSVILKQAAFSREKNPRPDTVTRYCGKCETGWVRKRKEGEFGVRTYCFRCSCEGGQKLGKSILTWDERFLRQGYFN